MDNDHHIMIKQLELPQATHEFDKKDATLTKLKEHAETVEAERWDVYVVFFRTVTKELKVLVGSTCKYMKATALAKSDLEFAFSRHQTCYQHQNPNFTPKCQE